MKEYLNQSNESIIKFMELIKKEGNHFVFDIPNHYGSFITYNDALIFALQKVKFHSSWDSLMPVMEKIHRNEFVKEVSIRPGRTRIWFNHPRVGYMQSPHEPQNTSIQECYIVAVNFIKWYNEQTRSNSN